METFFNETNCYIYLITAFVILIAEVFIPSFGLLSVVAVLFGVASVISAFHVSAVMGFVILTIVVIGFPVILVSIFKNIKSLPIGNKLIPEAPVYRSSVEEDETKKYVGRTAVTLTALRPSGILKIDGKRIDVLTEGEHIEANVKVIIIRVEGSRIVVRKTKSS